MSRAIVFGTVAADIVLRVPVVPPAGTLTNGHLLGWRLGGSSANIACALAAARHDAELVGPVGSDTMAEALLDDLRRRGVGTDRAVRMHGPSPRAFILLDERGERTIIVVDQDSCVTSFRMREVPDLNGVDLVYVQGYCQYPVGIATAAPSALIVTTPPSSARTSWPADVVVGSEEQFQTGWLRSPFDSMRPLAGARLRWVVVTRGARGADACGRAGSLHVPACPAEQVDTTGAGDAFVAGLMHGLATGGDIVEAMRVGAAWGAAAVGRLQSAPVSWDDLFDVPPSR